MNAAMTSVPDMVDVPDHFMETCGAWKRTRMDKPRVYDAAYVERYNKYDCHRMSELRWEELIYHCPGLKRGFSLLDFGCGNGAFVEVAKSARHFAPEVHGWDIAGYPLPFELTEPWARQFDVITFFDSLEHVEHLDMLFRNISASYLVVSVPWCHGQLMGAEWFDAWKHNRPDEHWWYFDAASLCNRMRRYGFEPVFIGNPEDKVRKGPDHLPNILTGVFKNV